MARPIQQSYIHPSRYFDHDQASSAPIYLQITNTIIQNIRQGRFRKGLRLPGSREMAALLKISRDTVIAAYQELEAQGWVEILPQKGAFIKVDPQSLAPKKIKEELLTFKTPQKPGFNYDEKRILPFHSPDFPPAGKLVMNDGFPDVRLAPIEDLIRSIRRLARLSSNKKYLTYGGAQGTLFLREALAAFLCDTRGLSITPDNILITRGAQMGIYLSSSILLRPGDEIVVGTPGYAGGNRTYLQLGAKINHAPMDEDGIDIDYITRLCNKKNIRMVYVIPHHHHPTSVTLSPDRRLRLLELAARYKFAIMEDDYDYDFHYTGRPIMPMASLDRNGNVIYIGALTKYLAPAIRVGFIVAPQQFIRDATWLRRSIDTQGDSLIENAIAQLYKDGAIARHIKTSVKLYKERRDHFCNLLTAELGQHVSFKIPEGGMSVWTRFHKNDLPLVAQKALKKGLIMFDGSDYDTEKIKYNAVGLGFASLNFKEQEQAIGILKTIF